MAKCKRGSFEPEKYAIDQWKDSSKLVMQIESVTFDSHTNLLGIHVIANMEANRWVSLWGPSQHVCVRMEEETLP
jgi:hypothetical protein